MVPDIAGNGASFRGAGAYYLHDKPYSDANGERVNPTSSDRVAWTLTRNTIADTPDAAIDEMWRTSDTQQQLKANAGIKLTGRKTVEPVKTLSLAWHPDESPSKEQMIEAADQYLAHMGWSEHQALYVAHTDTAHPHVHVIINRVHPLTGRTLDDYREKIRSQVWALAYERENGRILCEIRPTRDYAAEAIPKRELTVPNTVEKEGRAQEAPFVAASIELAAHDKTERDLLHSQQSSEREAFFATAKTDLRAARQQAYLEVRREFRPQWKEHYTNAKMLTAQARELALQNSGQARELARSGKFGEAWQALAGTAPASGPEQASFDPVKLANSAIAEQRAAIVAAQRAARIERQQAACEAAFDSRAATYVGMKERQQGERHELRQIDQQRERGEPIDLARLNQLLNGPRPMPSAQDPNQLMAQLKTANENAAPIDHKAPSNDNLPPKFVAQRQSLAQSQAHIDLLLASARMTRSGSMANMQAADLATLRRRAERADQDRATARGGEGAPKPSPAASAETTDRLQRMAEFDTRSPEEKKRDSDELNAAAAKARDRGGGRDR